MNVSPAEENIEFPSGDDAVFLSGVLHLPAQPGSLSPVLVVAHGRWNTYDLPLLRDLCRGAAAQGLCALRFNFRYVDQHGEPSADGRQELADLRAAWEFTRNRYGALLGRTYLAGKSLGAIVAGRLATQEIGLGGYIALGYPLGLSPTEHLAELGCPALFVVGDRDPFCAVNDLQPVLDTIPTSTTLAVVAGGDHSYRPLGAGEDDAAYLPQALDATLQWLAAQIGISGRGKEEE